MPENDRTLKRRIRIEEALDRGQGSAALSNPDIGEIVENTLLHFDAERYRLHAWCVMPNHVSCADNASSGLDPFSDHVQLEIVHLKEGQCAASQAGFVWRPSTMIARSATMRITQASSTTSP
jgi:hypothetical protein